MTSTPVQEARQILDRLTKAVTGARLGKQQPKVLGRNVLESIHRFVRAVQTNLHLDRVRAECERELEQAEAMAGEVCRAPGSGQARRAPHPEMAERRRARGRTRTWSETGAPQGGSASPLLANVYLHYAFDLWAHNWRRKHAGGDVVIVRYADDVVVGFQRRADAERFRVELEERFRKFDLELHPDKTRLLEFGPFAADNRRKRSERRPETFDFLGFTHICAKSRSSGRFTVLRQTMRKRLQAKLNEVNLSLKRRLHEPVPEIGKWLRAVLTGHFNYYGVPRNIYALALFRFRVCRLWHRALGRRSHKGRITWDRMKRYIDRWLPLPSTRHPHPLERLGVIT